MRYFKTARPIRKKAHKNCIHTNLLPAFHIQKSTKAEDEETNAHNCTSPLRQTQQIDRQVNLLLVPAQVANNNTAHPAKMTKHDIRTTTPRKNMKLLVFLHSSHKSKQHKQKNLMFCSLGKKKTHHLFTKSKQRKQKDTTLGILQTTAGNRI